MEQMGYRLGTAARSAASAKKRWCKMRAAERAKCAPPSRAWTSSMGDGGGELRLCFASAVRKSFASSAIFLPHLPLCAGSSCSE